MGRNYRTVTTTGEVIRLELKYLLREGYLRKGYRLKEGVLHWAQGEKSKGSAMIETTWGDGEIWIRLQYRHTNNEGEQTIPDYKVWLEAKPSNLGRGEVLYFVCPETFTNCRILYLAYGSPIFKSRGAYRGRLYYPLQTSSQLDRYNDRYFRLEKKLKELTTGRQAYNYGGKVTRRRNRIEKLEDKQARADELRFTLGMPKALRRIIYG